MHSNIGHQNGVSFKNISENNLLFFPSSRIIDCVNYSAQLSEKFNFKFSLEF